MAYIIGIIGISLLYILLAAGYTLENPEYKTKSAVWVMVICVVLSIIGSVLALRIQVNTSYAASNGVITYEQCVPGKNVVVDRDPDSRSQITECSEYETRTEPVSDYIWRKTKNWAFYGTLASIILFFVAMPTLPKSLTERKPI